MSTCASPLILAVEGIVGSGKTSFLSAVRNSFLASKYAIFIVESPVVRWQDVEGVNLLKLYHHDPARYAMSFQMWCLNTRVETLAAHMRREIDPTDHRPVVTFVERTCSTDVDCFAQALLARGVMQRWEMELLRVHRRHIERVLPRANGIIMMNTPLDVSMRCIASRGREGEVGGVTRGLQTELAAQYTAWLRSTNVPRIHVDTVAAFHHQPASYPAAHTASATHCS